MPARRHPWPVRLLLGLTVAAGLLGAAELGLRLILGPPDPPILVAPRWTRDGPAFNAEADGVHPRYQNRDQVPSFAAEPTPGRPRVFVLGGSSVHGGSMLDHSIEFPALLEADLASSGLDAEVINLARPSLDSHGISIIVDEALAYRPDLLVLYLGHNDLGNTTMEARYAGVTGALEARTQVLLRRLKLYEILTAGAARSLPATQAQHADRFRNPPLDASQRLLAATSLRDNLLHIAYSAKRQGVAVIMVTPISELSRHPPSGTLCPEHQGLLEQRRGPRNQPETPELDRVLAAQPDCPRLLFARGERRLRADLPGACEDLLRANDLDPRPLAASEDMVQAVRDAAQISDAVLLDMRADVLAEHCVPPQTWFRDNVHFTDAGHRWIAAYLAPAVAAELER